jgi:hypothetical protein
MLRAFLASLALRISGKMNCRCFLHDSPLIVPAAVEDRFGSRVDKTK